MRSLVVLLFGIVLAGCQRGCRDDSIPGHLGRTLDEYGTRYGKAITSPVTPDQIAYDPKPGLHLTVRVVDGRSVEELWLTENDGDGVPEELLQRARALVASDVTPARTVAFKLRNRPPAEVLEVPAGTGLVQIERRAGKLTRVALCVEPQACRLLGYAQANEKSTDSLLAIAEEALRQQGPPIH